MAKIALELEAARRIAGKTSGKLLWRVIAHGEGWSVSDVICNAGPRDRSFEEQHSNFSIAVVINGTFQYRSSAGRELMTPGSLMLGNPGQCFECGHEHGVGDHCISFAYEPEYFEQLVSEAGVRTGNPKLRPLRVPPLREISGPIARACAGIAHPSGWEELAIDLAVGTLRITGMDPSRASLPAAEARVTRVVRMIESRPELDHKLEALARESKLSRYHFLRIFQRLTGLTPHQYIVRTRLRRAAARLIAEPARVLDIALDSGFGDVSNFNHAFHSEFGVSPRLFRKRRGGRTVTEVR